MIGPRLGLWAIFILSFLAFFPSSMTKPFRQSWEALELEGRHRTAWRETYDPGRTHCSAHRSFRCWGLDQPGFPHGAEHLCVPACLGAVRQHGPFFLVFLWGLSRATISEFLFVLSSQDFALRSKNLESQWPLASRHKCPKDQLASLIVRMDVREAGRGIHAQGPDYRGDAGNHNNREVSRLRAECLSGEQGQADERKSLGRPWPMLRVGPQCRGQREAGYVWWKMITWDFRLLKNK